MYKLEMLLGVALHHQITQHMANQLAIFIEIVDFRSFLQSLSLCVRGIVYLYLFIYSVVFMMLSVISKNICTARNTNADTKQKSTAFSLVCEHTHCFCMLRMMMMMMIERKGS